MSQLSRRTFMVQASLAGAAAASGAAATPLLAGAAPAAVPAPTTLLLHVRDVRTGEVAVLADAEEIVFRDSRLVASLLQAMARTGR